MWKAILLLFPLAAFADPSPLPDPGADVGGFITQLAGAFSQFGGLPWAGKVALIITLIIASMKVTFLDKLIWDRLGKFQAALPPVLGLIGGLLALGSAGNITIPGLLAYVTAGAGAIMFHEILDLVKGIPGIGPVWVSIIAAIESALGGNPQGVNG